MTAVTRQAIEDFLYAEAALLDEWKLDEWLGLLAEDFTYHVPATDRPELGPAEGVSLIFDDLPRIRSRVKQLLGGYAWAETPHSRTRRLITNVRLLGQSGDAITFTANFAVYRFRAGEEQVFVGRYEYAVRILANGWRIRSRKAVLDPESLRSQGRLSIIL
jgi:p-cumate 2,3-dioxygenase beta subunit